MGKSKREKKKRSVRRWKMKLRARLTTVAQKPKGVE